VKGGVIDRDQNGEPTGIFRDNAISLIDSVIPEYTDEQMGKALNAAMRSFLNIFIILIILLICHFPPLTTITKTSLN
jgi:hypothetical protein